MIQVLHLWAVKWSNTNTIGIPDMILDPRISKTPKEDKYKETITYVHTS
jgi:hypothetical protein